MTLRDVRKVTLTALDYCDEGGLVQALQDLVSIRSVFDPALPDGNERPVADYVESLVRAWDFEVERWDVAPNRPNLVIDLPGSRPGPVLVLEGHTDVVTEGDPDAWSVDPFGAQIHDGKLYGRGSADMKGGLVAMLFAARAIVESGADFAGTIRLAVLADEEGLMQGAKSFVERGYVEDASAAIICEPEGGRVCIAQKGAIRLRIDVTGKMAHGCMPLEGANPVTVLGELIAACRRLESEIQSESPPHPLLGGFHLTPTVALAGSAGQANVIPSRATLIIDVRTGPEHDHRRIIERISALASRAAGSVAGTHVEIEIVDDRPATETDPDDPVVQSLLHAHQDEFGNIPPFGGVPGSTDGTIFWAATRVPLVTYGPGDTTIPHQADEFVRIDEVIGCARVYVRAILEYFARMEAR